MEQYRLKALRREQSDQILHVLRRLIDPWRTIMVKSHSLPTAVCLHCSATCLPTSPCGGTVNPSWPLHSSACATCICMNWGTCGRSFSTWPWGLLWPCRSDWGSRWAKPPTTTSDNHQMLQKPQTVRTPPHRGGRVLSSVPPRRRLRPQPGPGGISARIGLFLEVFFSSFCYL